MSDLIRREDAIKAVSISCGTCLTRDTEDCEKCSVPKLRKLINAIPSTERLQGEWTNAGILTVHCSNCKSEFHELEAMNYCPKCGARMKGADDD